MYKCPCCGKQYASAKDVSDCYYKDLIEKKNMAFDINNFVIDRCIRGVMTSTADGSVMYSINQIEDPALNISAKEENDKSKKEEIKKNIDEINEKINQLKKEKEELQKQLPPVIKNQVIGFLD